MIFIAKNDTNGALHGDTVRVELHKRSDGKASGKVLCVLKAGVFLLSTTALFCL